MSRDSDYTPPRPPAARKDPDTPLPEGLVELREARDLMLGGEVRVKSPTGAEKGSKMERYDLIPVEPLRQLARHFGRGSLKYADRNWEAGYNWSLSYAALQRHANAFWGGEDIDAETGTPHIVAVAWHALALAEYMKTHPEFDDRPTTKDGR